MSASYLGIEIGGTKTQVGVGVAGSMDELRRFAVVSAKGAAGILENVERAARELIDAHRPAAIGVGFGGPVDAVSGRTITSHHINGWDDFPLTYLLSDRLGLPVLAANDCDVAALAEATCGAGVGKRSLFYVTVGSGIGGGFVLDSDIHAGFGRGAAEIGHLRPGLDCSEPSSTVESLASGWGLAEQARRRMKGEPQPSSELFRLCDSQLANLTAKHVADAAASGDAIASQVWERGLQALGWAIAQAVTLLAPEVVAVGGGVSLVGEERFFAPLRRHVERYVFPPFQGRVEIAPAALGEEVVLHGALALAEKRVAK